MKRTTTTLLVLAFLIAAACSSTKQAATPVATTTALPPAKPSDGIYAPGNEELSAIKLRNPNVTLEHLTEGYVIYSKGACINCHGANNIYQHGEDQWKHILDDMAPKANISNAQKAAVYAYILSIKATRPKKG